MKSFILIAVLAALTVCNNAASILNEVASGQEDVVLSQESGQVYQKDYNLEGATAKQFKNDELILLNEQFVNMAAIPNVVQIRDVVFFAESTTRITRIEVYDFYTNIISQNHGTHATVRLTSRPGEGIQATVKFSGYYTDSLI